MVVYVRTVRMGRHDKGIPAFCKPHCQLMSQTVGFFRRDLAGFKGLADLVRDYIVPGSFACDLEIQAFLKHEFFIYRYRITAVGSHQFSLLGFLRILRVIRSVFETSRHRPAFGRM